MKASAFALLAVMALPLSGCGDSTPTGPVTLTAADTKLLYQEIATTFSRAELERHASFARDATPGLSLSVLDVIAVTVQCSGGGTANFSGNDTSTPTTPAYDASVTYNACQTDHFQVAGSYHQSVVSSTTSIATTGGGDLTVKVLADGRSGTCHVDYSLTVASAGITATGTICGVDVNGAITG